MTDSNHAIRNRALGAWYGQLIGDSLGSLVEFRTQESIAAEYPEGVRDLADGGPFDLAAGQPTDDSELALALARSLVRNNGYDRDDVFGSYRRWMASGPFDSGNATVSAFRYGSPDPNTQANGALMRISPVAIAFHRDPARAADIARADAMLSHPHEFCQQVNALWVRVLAEVIGTGADPLPLFREHAGDLRPLVEKAADAAPPDVFEKQGWVRHAFQLTVFEAARGDGFEESLVRTVGRGGDTDTNAAIVGAFLGAVYGADAIPQRWIDAVDTCRPKRNRPAEYHPNDATHLVDALLTIDQPLIPEWIDAEINAGRTQLQSMLDAAPFDTAAVRTVAESGDFQIVDGHVRRAGAPAFTWFPDREPELTPEGQGRWSLTVAVTPAMRDDAPVPLPRAIGAVFGLWRMGHRSLDSRLGPQAVVMTDEGVRTASIRRFVDEEQTVRLVFDRAGTFDVR